MKTSKLLATALLATLVAACSNDRSTSPAPGAPAPVVKEEHPATAAVLVRGDLAPARLVAIALPPRTPQPLLSASFPGFPKKAFAVDRTPVASVRRDFARVVTADQLKGGSILLPIDAPRNARVLVSSRSPNGSIPTVHLVDALGSRLDRARDDQSHPVIVERVPLASKPKTGKEANAAPPADDRALAVLPTGEDVRNRKSTFEGISVPRRVLSIDVPYTAGKVTLQIPASALKDGIEIDVQQPESSIALSGAPHELNYGFGDIAEVEYTLADGDKPLDGAKMTGTVALPNGERLDGVEFVAKGGGRYVARVPLASADLKTIGVWHVYAKATGVTADGVEFERDVDNGFGYAPAHARMMGATDPLVVRGADGLIDQISIDVQVESVADDRLGVSAALVFKTPDGSEHSVASAETSADVKAGSSTITLHFDAKDVALAMADGPYFVRELTLMSHTFATTQHVLNRGLNLSTSAIDPTEIRYPTTFAPAVQELFDLGHLDRK